jgi:hypothetical protein
MKVRNKLYKYIFIYYEAEVEKLEVLLDKFCREYLRGE